MPRSSSTNYTAPWTVIPNGCTSVLPRMPTPRPQRPVSSAPRGALTSLTYNSFSRCFLPTTLSPSPSSSFLSTTIFPSIFLATVHFSSTFTSTSSTPPRLYTLRTTISACHTVPRSSTTLRYRSCDPRSFPPTPVQCFPSGFPPVRTRYDPTRLPSDLSFLCRVPVIPPRVPVRGTPRLPSFMGSTRPH